MPEALTATEAASVAQVPLKQVHRIIDADLLDGSVEVRAGTRVITGKGIVGLKLAHLTAEILTLDARRRIIRTVLSQPRARTARDGAVSIDLRPIESSVRTGLEALRTARKTVSVDRQVMGGAPCIRGTRIPVHDIAAMIVNGETRDSILEAYPALDAASVDAALVYASAYPLRGRPKRTEARGARRIAARTLKLSDLPPLS